MKEIRVDRRSPGEVLDRDGVVGWPAWTKEAPESPRSGEPVPVGKGDLVTFPAGLRCTWKVLRPVRKHYRFG